MIFLIIGYFFIFFRFTLNGFDLLPNFFGYILISVGLMKLENKSNQFVKAKPWAIALVWTNLLFSLGVLFKIQIGGATAVTINSLILLITIYLSYLIVSGLQDIELINNVKIGASDLKLIWIIWAILTTICKMLVFVPNATITLVLSVFTLITFVTNTIFLAFLYKVKKACDTIR